MGFFKKLPAGDRDLSTLSEFTINFYVRVVTRPNIYNFFMPLSWTAQISDNKSRLL